MKTRQTLLEIETSNNGRTVDLLQQQFAAEQKENKVILPFQDKEQTAAINKLLVQQDIDVYTLHPQQNDLEQLFIDITSDNI
jgi:ABC-2 type transport system ATP-binding protein